MSRCGTPARVRATRIRWRRGPLASSQGREASAVRQLGGASQNTALFCHVGFRQAGHLRPRRFPPGAARRSGVIGGGVQGRRALRAAACRGGAARAAAGSLPSGVRGSSVSDPLPTPGRRETTKVGKQYRTIGFGCPSEMLAIVGEGAARYPARSRCGLRRASQDGCRSQCRSERSCARPSLHRAKLARLNLWARRKDQAG
ncbi:hypothetical protein SPMU_22370 [Sphingomonas mucosissima]|uniref:Uncharacterized protein n=1 Tax=Sphingomonas mucosissima TaxID=370959 RepID=A0A245ZJB2_9SPHN|nr:hypothetical protein SPMU_22370 [Sphingomonas mucosissima]